MMKQAILRETAATATQAEKNLWDSFRKHRPEMHLDMQGLHLLLIEDETADAALACEMLEEGMPDYAWHIDRAVSIREAIPKLSTQCYDLALVDLGLQDIEGPQTVDVLCMIAPHVPIVVYSGTDSDLILREALHRGAFICLQKNGTTSSHLRIALINALSHSALKS